MVSNEHPVTRWCCTDNAIPRNRGIVKGIKMGDQHRSGKSNDRQGQANFLWRMLCLTTRKCGTQDCGAASHREPAGLRGTSDEGRIGRRRAGWPGGCRRKPRDWEDDGNHGTPQIARAVERGAHNESSVAAMLHVRYVKSSSCFRSPAGPQTRSLTGAGCSVLIALWINSSKPPSGPSPPSHHQALALSRPPGA